MRTSLIGSLVPKIKYNHARKVPRIRVFEVGRVFLRDPAARTARSTVAGRAPADAHRRRCLRSGRTTSNGTQPRARSISST